MGAGKTTAGKALAALLKWKFIDMDKAIEQRCAMPVSEIFKQHGEIYFRDIERDALNELLKTEKGVIAAGGGAPVFHNNLKRMKESGFVVYLSCSENTIAARLDIAEKAKRPLAEPGKEGNELQRLMAFREPYYKSAHATVICDNKRPQEIAKEITAAYKTWKNLH